jgi:hypothetical protein
MIVDIEVERERPELMAALKRWIAAEPAIQRRGTSRATATSC